MEKKKQIRELIPDYFQVCDFICPAVVSQVHFLVKKVSSLSYVELEAASRLYGIKLSAWDIQAIEQIKAVINEQHVNNDQDSN